MWKTKEELTKSELLYLRLGYLVSKKARNGETYFKIS